MFRANTFPEREKCDLLIEPYNLYGYSNTELEKNREIHHQSTVYVVRSINIYRSKHDRHTARSSYPFFQDLTKLVIPKKGLFDLCEFIDFLRTNVKAKNLEELQIPLMFVPSIFTGANMTGIQHEAATRSAMEPR